MATCNDFRDVLLDLLYGLVDGPQEQEMQAHLAACSTCQMELEEAKRQQKLFARAAHVYRQVPVFTAPAEAPPAAPITTEEPAVIKMPSADQPRRRWLRWAAAAAVLLAAGAALVYEQRLDHYQTEVTQTKKTLEQVDSRLTQLQKSYPKKQAELAAQVPVRNMHLQVIGSARQDADAPRPIQVRTSDPSGRPISARITVAMVANGREIARTQATSNGDTTITLPPISAAGAAQLAVEARPELLAATTRIQRDVQVDDPTLVTHLVTNKSVYQVGETLLFRTLTLQRASLQPPSADKKIEIKFILRDSEGRQPRMLVTTVGPGGISGGDMPVPINLNGGEYTLEVTSRDPNVLPQQRRITIVSDLPPRVQFDRKHYHPGDTVKVTFTAGRRVRGSVIPNQILAVQAEADGSKLSINDKDPGKPVQVRTDVQGNVTFEFRLPARLTKSEARLEIQVEGGQKLTQPIPLAGAKLTVEFFPEGGDLVAGVPNRVYFRVRNERGEPVDPQGHISVTGQDGKPVFDAYLKQALGVFTFTPKLNEKFGLHLTFPHGATEAADVFKDLAVRGKGIAMRVVEPVSSAQKPLRVVLDGTEDDQRVLIVATCRGQVVGQKYVTVSKERREESLELVKGTRGVIRLTLYRAGGERLAPLAERLIYRLPAERLTLSIANWKPVVAPGASLNWKVQATNEQGGAEQAWMLAAVIDQKLLDGRALQPPAHFYLTSDVRGAEDLENVDVLVMDGADARQALDLFLGTQGWRRFAAGSEAPAFALGKDEKAGVIFSSENDNQANLLARANADLKRSLAALRRDRDRDQDLLQEERASAVQAFQAAFIGLTDFENLPVTCLRTGAGILMVILLLAGGALLFVGMLRLLRRTLAPTSAFGGAFGTLAACLVLYAVSGSFPTLKDIQVSDRGHAVLPPRLPGDGIPDLRPGTDRSLPVGSYAMAPGIPVGGQARHDLMTADMYARLLNREKLPMTAASVRPIPPVPMPVVKQKPTQENKDGPRFLRTDVPSSLRVFAFEPSANPTLADTLLWHPVLVAENGAADISFGLPGNITSYRVLLYGNTPNGRLGVFQGQLQVRP